MSDVTADGIPQSFKAAILSAFPELSGARFNLLTTGWDSVAVDVDDRLIFKFPRDGSAEQSLRKEAGLLAVIRPAVTMSVPDLELIPGPPLFSRHEKLKGDHLATAEYRRLPQDARQRLAADMARFYAEIHRLDRQAAAAAGAGPVEPWQSPDAVRDRAIPALPPRLRSRAGDIVAAFEALPPDPHGTTYGFFDGHGWNMAFDHESGRLNGVYDFADSGFGPLHQEFIYTNFISPDLTSRIIAEYEPLAGRAIDRRRVDLLTGMHRLSELAELADDPQHVDAMIGYVRDWLEGGG